MISMIIKANNTADADPIADAISGRDTIADSIAEAIADTGTHRDTISDTDPGTIGNTGTVTETGRITGTDAH